MSFQCDSFIVPKNDKRSVTRSSFCRVFPFFSFIFHSARSVLLFLPNPPSSKTDSRQSVLSWKHPRELVSISSFLSRLKFPFPFFRTSESLTLVIERYEQRARALQTNNVGREASIKFTAVTTTDVIYIVRDIIISLSVSCLRVLPICEASAEIIAFSRSRYVTE